MQTIRIECQKCGKTETFIFDGCLVLGINLAGTLRSIQHEIDTFELVKLILKSMIRARRRNMTKLLERESVYVLCKRCDKRSDNFKAELRRDDKGWETIVGLPEGWIPLQAEFIPGCPFIYGMCPDCNPPIDKQIKRMAGIEDV
jgi:hypothetical protein